MNIVDEPPEAGPVGGVDCAGFRVGGLHLPARQEGDPVASDRYGFLGGLGAEDGAQGGVLGAGLDVGPVFRQAVSKDTVATPTIVTRAPAA